MNKVNVMRTKVLDKIQMNRDAHIALFNKAMAGWRTKALINLKEALAKVNEGAEPTTVYIPAKPTSYEKEYNKIIAMLEWSTDDIVELTDEQVQQYILDVWSWTDHFNVTASGCIL